MAGPRDRPESEGFVDDCGGGGGGNLELEISQLPQQASS